MVSRRSRTLTTPAHIITSGREVRWFVELRVNDGTRTRDLPDHNRALYRLSYKHHARPKVQGGA